MNHIVVLAHNVRSCYNVGSLLRTAEGLGVEKVYLTGYTPYPLARKDPRLPHLARKIHTQISKSSLGAENLIPWEHMPDIRSVIKLLKGDGYRIVALEQTEEAMELSHFRIPKKLALIIGREVEGIEPEVLRLADDIVQIPMLGHKESFNVVQAAAMALYHFRFMQT